MVTEDQSTVVAFLALPSAHGGSPVERIETHASIVFLAGDRALKLKRAVRYDYLDFSTLEKRKAMCEAEVRINRRTAPGIYRGVVAVVRRSGGELAIGGDGTPVEWLVEMNRFDQQWLFDRLAGRDALDLAFMAPLASAIARFHLGAEHRADHGGRRGMAWVIDGNAAAFSEERTVLDQRAAAAVTRQSTAALERHGALLDRRREAGFVRQCHGDLHLRNIVWLDGRPTLFDAIEFNDEIACGDVLYDLAFLLMDLWRRRLPRHANAILNRYLSETLDFAGTALLPLFLSCRAAVRAKTSATAARMQSDPARRAELEEMARGYLALAATFLQPPAAALVAVGGFSGSGKSMLARALAPEIGAAPGAVVVSSDEIRKRLCGMDPLARLGPEGYTQDVTRRVYATLAERAAVLLRAGHSVIADAVFASPTDRDAMALVADAADAPFAGLWLDAPEQVMAERTKRRREDPSDAGPAVVRAQMAQGAGLITWNRVPASGDAAGVLGSATRIVEASQAVGRRP